MPKSKRLKVPDGFLEGAKARAISSQNLILFESSASQADLAHEEVHLKYKDRRSRNLEDFLFTELRADLESGRTRMLSSFRRLLNDSVSIYDLNLEESLGVLTKVMKKFDVPRHWKTSFRTLQREVVELRK